MPSRLQRRQLPMPRPGTEKEHPGCRSLGMRQHLPPPPCPALLLPAPTLARPSPRPCCHPGSAGQYRHRGRCHANRFRTRAGMMPRPPAHPCLLLSARDRDCVRERRGGERRGCPPLRCPAAGGGMAGSRPSSATPRAGLSPSSAGRGFPFSLRFLSHSSFFFFIYLKKKKKLFLSRKHLRSQVSLFWLLFFFLLLLLLLSSNDFS